MGILDETVPQKRKRSRWKIIVPVVLTLLLLVMYGCYRTVLASQREALESTLHLHEQMNAGKYDEIYAEADEGFRKSTTAEESLALFSGVGKKLGVAQDTKPLGTNVNATNTGTYIRANYSVNYTNDYKAEEVVVWRKSDGVYRLYGFHISSNALLK